MSDFTEEKKYSSLKKMGENLHKQRTIILKLDINQFIDSMNKFAKIKFNEEIVLNMENGNPVSIEYWIYVWIYFQNIEKIIASYDINEMIFLAKQDFVDNIENELINHYKGKDER